MENTVLSSRLHANRRQGQRPGESVVVPGIHNQSFHQPRRDITKCYWYSKCRDAGGEQHHSSGDCHCTALWGAVNIALHQNCSFIQNRSLLVAYPVSDKHLHTTRWSTDELVLSSRQRQRQCGAPGPTEHRLPQTRKQ